MGLVLSAHPDPVLEDAIAGACRWLADLNGFAERHANALQAGRSAGDLRGLTADDHERQYGMAMALYQAANYARALPLSLVLVAHEARSAKYSYLAGLCLQKLQHHREAVALYLMALKQDAGHVPAAFRMGECCTALGESDAARQAYEHVLALSRGDERYRELQSEAMARLP